MLCEEFGRIREERKIKEPNLISGFDFVIVVAFYEVREVSATDGAEGNY